MTNLPANTSDMTELETGLEDFSVEDAVVPRLSILHRDGLFKDSLTGDQFEKIDAVILGLVKQRILWHTLVENDDRPMCRSVEQQFGWPNVSEDTKKDKRFPFELAGFNPADYPPNEDGWIKLPCAGCQLKEWGSHPDGKKPYCSEQFTLPILYAANPDSSTDFVPAILTFAKTGLKPLKAYLTGFSRSQSAAYQAITQIGLNVLSRGQNAYSVPTFRTVGKTDEENWRSYSAQYKLMKRFLQTPPSEREEEGETSLTSPATPPETTVAANAPQAAANEEAQRVQPAQEVQAVQQPAQPEQAAEPDDDDLPF